MPYNFSSLYCFPYLLPDNFCIISMWQALFPTMSLYFSRAKSYTWSVLVLCTFPSPSSCHTVSTTCPQCLQTCTSSWSCCILHRSSQSSAAYCLGEIYMSCLISRSIKEHLSLFHSHQPGPWATMLQVSFISSAIRFHICVLHIQNYIMKSLVICTPYQILCGW